MATAAFRKRLRVALDPPLLLWALGRLLNWPVRKRRERAYWKKRRAVPLGPPETPVDLATTAAALAGPGPRVVFLGTGLGEFNMMRQVAEALREARPGLAISVGLRNNDALAFVRDRFPGLNAFYWPQDGVLNAARWLAAQQPDVIVITEAHRQPALVRAARVCGASVVLMNGCCRDRKAYHNPLRRHFARWVFRGYDAMAMRGNEFLRIAAPLVSPLCRLRTVGDLKADVPIPTLPDERLASLESWLDPSLPIVGAGSTDDLGEERMVLAAFLRVREGHPCRLLLAPRNPRIDPRLLDAIREAGLTVSRRSEACDPADVLLLDTMSELASAYRACDSAYVGGSYSEGGGGHNAMEPLIWGVPVAYGMERGNFEAIQRLLEERGLGVRVGSAAELASFWARFLTDPAERARVGGSARSLIEENRGAVARTVALLESVFDARGS